ncbi:MAG: hypothetical protein UFG06_13815 [Lachnospiraceae bacterium]|nr:hypothetical protein [Lachnospiraceae bacterium]
MMKAGENMGTKNINLTDDPLTNIHIMVPMLNDDARKRFSDMMFGCFIGTELADGINKEKSLCGCSKDVRLEER